MFKFISKLSSTLQQLQHKKSVWLLVKTYSKPNTVRNLLVVNNKDSRMTSLTLFCICIVNYWSAFRTISNISMMVLFRKWLIFSFLLFLHHMFERVLNTLSQKWLIIEKIYINFYHVQNSVQTSKLFWKQTKNL